MKKIRPRTPNLICIFILIKTPKNLQAVAPPLRVYKSTFNKNTRKAFGVITLPLREGKIFCKKILGGGLETKSKNRQFLFSLVYKRFIFFFKKDSRRGLLRFAHDPVLR